MKKILDIINEEIVSHNAEQRKKFYDDTEYNNGEREIIELPSSSISYFLYDSDIQFERILQGGNQKDVNLFYNGNQFAVIIHNGAPYYYGFVDKQEYLKLKSMYENKY